jgi:hypothetical protein
MSSPFRQFISRFLLIALVFNALTPLIAAAQDRAGKGSILEFCTASGLKQIAVNLDSKTLPSPAAEKTNCPFCLLSSTPAVLPSTALTLAYVQLQPQAPPEYRSLAQTRSAHSLTAAPRGPPALA